MVLRTLVVVLLLAVSGCTIHHRVTVEFVVPGNISKETPADDNDVQTPAEILEEIIQGGGEATK